MLPLGEQLFFTEPRSEQTVEPISSPEPSTQFEVSLKYTGRYSEVYVSVSLNGGDKIRESIYVLGPNGGHELLMSNKYKYLVQKSAEQGTNISFIVRDVNEIFIDPYRFKITAKSDEHTEELTCDHTVELTVAWKHHILEFAAQDQHFLYEPGKDRELSILFQRLGEDQSVQFRYSKEGDELQGLKLPQIELLGKRETLKASFEAPHDMAPGSLDHRVGIKIRERNRPDNSKVAYLKGNVVGKAEIRQWRRESIPDAVPAVKKGIEPSIFGWWENESLKTLHVVYCTPDNNVVELYQVIASDTWSVAKSNGAVNAGNICGYTWRKDGSQHLVTVNGSKIDELWRRSTDAPWRIGSWVSPSVKPWGNPRGYVWEGDRVNGTQHIVFRDDAARIWEAWSPKDKDPREWAHAELLAKATRPAGELFPYVWEDDPQTVQHKRGSQHILYRSNDGRIIEFWGRVLGKTQDAEWGLVDISAEAPPAAGDPIGYAWKEGMFVLYCSAQHHVVQLSHRNRGWMPHQALTEAAKAPPAAGSITGAFLDHSDTLNVIYRGMDEDLHEIRRVGNEWKHALLRVTSAATPPAPEQIASFSCSVNGRPKAYIVYATKDGQLIILSREQERLS